MSSKNVNKYRKQFNSNYRNCIYRYRPFDADGNNISALENDRLYFSTPVKFNDPFDTLIFANLRKIVFRILDLTDNESYHTEEYVGSIACHVDNTKKLIRNNLKIISFSENYNSRLMWSHYADNHKGFSLIYDKDDLKNAKCYNINEELLDDKILLKKVNYVSEQIDLTDEVGNFIQYYIMEGKEYNISEEKIHMAITQKSTDWKYEREWRLISKNFDLLNKSELGYIECMPKGIILGVHCSEENRENIIKIAQSKNIPVYKMFLDEFSPTFKLNVGDGINAKTV